MKNFVSSYRASVKAKRRKRNIIYTLSLCGMLFSTFSLMSMKPKELKDTEPPKIEEHTETKIDSCYDVNDSVYGYDVNDTVYCVTSDTIVFTK